MMVGWGGGTGGQLTAAVWLGAGDSGVPGGKGEDGRKSDTGMKSKSFPNRCVVSALILQETQG